MDAAVDFFDLVDCTGGTVLAIPAGRAEAAPAEARVSDHKRVHDPATFVAYMGDWVMPFGMHKGLPIKEIPRPYLEWLSTAPSVRSAFKTSGAHRRNKQFKTRLRRYLRLTK